LARASKIMAPTSCFTGQVHRLPDAPEAYGAMITRAKAAPPQSRSTDRQNASQRWHTSAGVYDFIAEAAAAMQESSQILVE
jgi:hypothetical protein